MEIDYKKIMIDFSKNLNYEISQKTTPFHIEYIVKMSLAGRISDLDRAELKGYYSGLKVAREMLLNALCATAEMVSDDECSKNCEFAEICEALGCEIDE